MIFDLFEDNKPKKWLVFQNTIAYCDWLKVESNGNISIQGGVYKPCRYIGCFKSVDARKFQIDTAKGELAGNSGVLYSTLYDSLEGKPLITEDVISKILSYPNKGRGVRNGKGESLFSFFQIDADSDEETEMKKVSLTGVINKNTAMEWIGYLLNSSNFDNISSHSLKEYVLNYRDRYNSYENETSNNHIDLEEILYSLYDEDGNKLTPKMSIDNIPIEDKIALNATSYVDTLSDTFSKYGRSNLIYGFTVKGLVAYIGVTKSSSGRGKQYVDELTNTTDGRLLVSAFKENLIESMIIFKSNFPLIGSRLSIDLNIVRPLEKLLCSKFNTYPAKYPTALNSAKPGTNCGKYSFRDLLKINSTVKDIFSSERLLTSKEYFSALATAFDVVYTTAANSDYLPSYAEYTEQAGINALSTPSINWELLRNLYRMGREGKTSGNVIFHKYWSMNDVEQRLMFKHQFDSVSKSLSEFSSRANQYADHRHLNVKTDVMLLNELLKNKQYEKFRKVYLKFPGTVRMVVWKYYISLSSASDRNEFFERGGLSDKLSSITVAENKAKSIAKKNNMSFVPIAELPEENFYNTMNIIDDEQSIKDRIED